MSKKHTLRRSVAGILAVLTVSGNLIAPAQFGTKTIAENAIVAEAATIDNTSRWNSSGIEWDASNGTLTIKKGITNADGAVNKDHPDQITGTIHSSFFSTVAYRDVKHIVIEDGAAMPKSWYHLFENFTNLESFVVKSKVDAANVYDFGWAFAGLTKLTTVDLSGLDNIGTIDYIENMFNGCSSLKVVNLSMLTGDNAGIREWSQHQAIEHISKVVAGCNQIEDLNLSGEYLYNLVENIKEKQGSGVGNIDSILNQLLGGNTSPHIEEIRERLKTRYLEYKAAIENEMQWKPYDWHWTETETGFTCTVDVRKKVKKTSGYGYEYQTETGKVCEISSSVATVPTCEQDGIRTFIAKWTNTEVDPAVTFTCDDNTHVKPEPAYGHSYQGASCDWAEDYSAADFVEVCSRCDDERRTPATVTSEHHDATCTEDAYTVYKADANGLHDEVKVTEENSALGHDFSTFVNFIWSADYTSATAVLKCSRCDETKEFPATVTAETKAPTCTAAGETVYTASYNGNTESKTVADDPATDHTYGEPAWSWSEDASAATATFTCVKGDDVQTVEAVIGEGVVTKEPGLAETGTMTYTATATFNDVEYTSTYDVPIAPTFIIKQNHTLLVNGKIGVNYLVQFADGVENPVMTAWHIQKDGEWQKTEIVGRQNLNDDGEWDGRYRFTYQVAAPEMAETIYCTYAATLNGEAVSTDAENPFTYSVQEYLDGRMEKSTDEKMRTLAAYMATYGAYAQQYFEVSTENLANANVERLYGEVTVDPSFVNTEAAEEVIADSIENPTAAVTSHSLVLNAATTLRYIITLDDESLLPDAYLAYRVAGSEEDFRYSKIGRSYREDSTPRLTADIYGIKAPELTDAYEAYVCVKTEDGYEQISLTTIYSPECYIASRLEKSSNETLKNTLISLMMYCEAARDYFDLDAIAAAE